MRGIVTLFASFEKFLHELDNAQEGRKQMISNAVLNYDTSTASHCGRESMSHDRTAISLTWDSLVAQWEDLLGEVRLRSEGDVVVGKRRANKNNNRSWCSPQ